MKLKTLLVLFILSSLFVYNSYASEKDAEQQTRRVVVTDNAFTPHLRLNIYTFYAFDDKVDSYYSDTEFFDGKIKGGFQWGGGLEYLMSPVQGIELSYLRLDSNAPMRYYHRGEGQIKNTNFDVNTNYIMVGSNRYFKGTGKVEPYAGIQAGVGIINPKNPDTGWSDTATKFAWGAKLGLNLWASDRVGLKIEGGLNSAVQAAGGSFYFGTGGAGAGVSTYSSFYQFYIGGGLSFSLEQ